MLAIIAHHYVVNSTVFTLFDNTGPTAGSVFLQLWGMWGKTAINSFILISGYYLCTTRLTWQRYVKLLAEAYFYIILIKFIFVATGYETMTLKLCVKELLFPFYNVGNGFTPSFLAFYAFVPIYNKLIHALTEREFRFFLFGVLFVISVCGTLFYANVFLEPLWYAVLYFTASYIRLFPNKFTQSLSLSIVIFVVSVVMAVLSVLYNIFYSGNVPYLYVQDSHKILPFVVGTSAFLIAKNSRVFKSRVINTISAGTFGVLLIHANCASMRKWLWQDIIQVPLLYEGNASYSSYLPSGLYSLVIVSIATPVVVFGICTLIDYFRRIFLEKYYMKWIYTRWSDNK
ncbi:MAG: hypothetical protein HUJ96_06020 [Marinilabiliaceae bacterium]|nr:hypothetical protein [Marinilabiliaceae bacterium]